MSGRKYPPGSRIYVNNIDVSFLDRRGFEEIFGKYGHIEELKFFDKYAFCQYADAEAATRAIQAENMRQCGSRKLSVAVANDRPGRGGAVSNQRSDSHSHSHSHHSHPQQQAWVDPYATGGPESRKRTRSPSPPPQPTLRNPRLDRMQRSLPVVLVLVTSPALRHYAEFLFDTLASCCTVPILEFCERAQVVERIEDAYRKSGIVYVCVVRHHHLDHGFIAEFRAGTPSEARPHDTLFPDIINFIHNENGTQADEIADAMAARRAPQGLPPPPAMMNPMAVAPPGPGYQPRSQMMMPQHPAPLPMGYHHAAPMPGMQPMQPMQPMPGMQPMQPMHMQMGPGPVPVPMQQQPPPQMPAPPANPAQTQMAELVAALLKAQAQQQATSGGNGGNGHGSHPQQGPSTNALLNLVGHPPSGQQNPHGRR